MRLAWRQEAPQFGFPNANIGSPTAGRITSTIADNRSMQFALKLDFRDRPRGRGRSARPPAAGVTADVQQSTQILRRGGAAVVNEPFARPTSA